MPVCGGGGGGELNEGMLGFLVYGVIIIMVWQSINLYC